MTAPTTTDHTTETPTVDTPPAPVKRSKAKPDRDLIVYATKSGKWHWKLLSPNGQVVSARSGPDGYKRRDDAAAAAKRLIDSLSTVEVRLIVRKADGTVDDRGIIR